MMQSGGRKADNDGSVQGKARLYFLVAVDAGDDDVAAALSMLTGLISNPIFVSELVSIHAVEVLTEISDSSATALSMAVERERSRILDGSESLQRVDRLNDWRRSGRLWPVIWRQDDHDPPHSDDEYPSPDRISTSLTWDALIVRTADKALMWRAVEIASETWARRRTLKLITHQTQEALSQQTLNPARAASRIAVIDLRRQLLNGLVQVDARVNTFNAFEIQLIQQCYDAWGIEPLEMSTRSAIDALSEFISDSRQIKQETSGRRLESIVLLLTVVSGFAALTAIWEFVGSIAPWEPRLLPRGLIAVALVVLFVLLLFRYRNLVRPDT